MSPVFAVVLRQNSARRRILIHVTCYTASLYVIDFTCALDFGEAHVDAVVAKQDGMSALGESVHALFASPATRTTK
jgi:hypothetical protein